MRVAVLPADESGCGTYRMLLPGTAVQNIRPDWEVTLHRPGTVHVGSDSEGNLRGVRGINPDEVDLMVMQRVGSQASCKFVRWATERGIAVTVDSDDALWAIENKNQAWRAWNGGESHWRYMDEAALYADLMTVTTRSLADRYGKHGRVEVIPNYVAEEVLGYESIRDSVDERVRIGWTGFTATHPGDLLVCGGAVRTVIEETGAVARVIADAAGAARDWGLDSDQIEGYSPLKLGPDYFTGMTTIDIGLVPLASTRFNRAKSSLKALEFSAMGVPVITSPTPANRELGRDLPIMFASNAAEWYDHLLTLIESPSLREEIGQRAKEAVKKRWTIEANAEKWAVVWERAVARRARMVAA